MIRESTYPNRTNTRKIRISEFLTLTWWSGAQRVSFGGAKGQEGGFMSEQYKGMMIGGIAGLLLGVLLMMLLKQGDVEGVSIDGSGTGFKFELKAKEKEVNKNVFESIWKDNNFRPVLADWIKGKDYISKTDEVAIGKIVSKLSPDAPLAKTIQELEEHNLGPFEILADSAVISVPSYEVRTGRVYTWEGNYFVGDTITFYDPDANHKPLKLFCTDELGAQGKNSKLGRNFFHISEKDYNMVLGDRGRSGAAKGRVNFKPLGK